MDNENTTIAMPENKMGTMPIRKLLINMSLPPMVSMLVAALYNVIDALFVTKAMPSGEGLTAMTLVFPVQMFMMAITTGIGTGLTSLISRRLGERRQDDANSAAAHGFILALVTWVLYTLFGIFLSEPFLRIFTGTGGNETVFEMALIYCRIVMIGSLFFNISVTVERILQATGNTMYPMIFNISACGVNIVMAPILIMGYAGAPALGVTGAGYAAIIGQLTGCIISLILFVMKKHAVRVSFRGFRLHLETIRDIFAVGVPTIVMQAMNPILIGAMNKLLFDYASAVFILGVYFRISTFAILPALGLNMGAMPIMGYNYGAKNRLRLMATHKSAFFVTLAIMVVAFVIFWIFPEQLMMLFNASGDTITHGAHALRTITLHWIPCSFVIITIGMFQALAHGIFALIISIVRQLGFILPLAYILLLHFGVDGVWYSYPLAEISALTLTVLFLVRIYRKEIKHLPDGAPVS